MNLINKLELISKALSSKPYFNILLSVENILASDASQDIEIFNHAISNAKTIINDIESLMTNKEPQTADDKQTQPTDSQGGTNE